MLLGFPQRAPSEAGLFCQVSRARKEAGSAENIEVLGPAERVHLNAGRRETPVAEICRKAATPDRCARTPRSCGVFARRARHASCSLVCVEKPVRRESLGASWFAVERAARRSHGSTANSGPGCSQCLGPLRRTKVARQMTWRVRYWCRSPEPSRNSWCRGARVRGRGRQYAPQQRDICHRRPLRRRRHRCGQRSREYDPAGLSEGLSLARLQAELQLACVYPQRRR
jgi:hypothetical protein